MVDTIEKGERGEEQVGRRVRTRDVSTIRRTLVPDPNIRGRVRVSGDVPRLRVTLVQLNFLKGREGDKGKKRI